MRNKFRDYNFRQAIKVIKGMIGIGIKIKNSNTLD